MGEDGPSILESDIAFLRDVIPQFIVLSGIDGEDVSEGILDCDLAYLQDRSCLDFDRDDHPVVAVHHRVLEDDGGSQGRHVVITPVVELHPPVLELPESAVRRRREGGGGRKRRQYGRIGLCGGGFFLAIGIEGIPGQLARMIILCHKSFPVSLQFHLIAQFLVAPVVGSISVHQVFLTEPGFVFRKRLVQIHLARAETDPVGQEQFVTVKAPLSIITVQLVQLEVGPELDVFQGPVVQGLVRDERIQGELPEEDLQQGCLVGRQGLH